MKTMAMRNLKSWQSLFSAPAALVIIISMAMSAGSATVLAAGNGPTAETKALPIAKDPVIIATQKLFTEAFGFNGTGAQVLLDLRATRDPALTPFFLKISHSADPRLQLLGWVDANYVSHNPKTLHLGKVLDSSAPELITPALAEAMQNGKLSTAQLMRVLTKAPQPAQRMMAATLLVKSHQKIVLPILDQTLASSRPSVRYYAALTLLQTDNPAQIRKGLAVLAELANRHSARLRRIKRLLLLRTASEKIHAASPWLLSIAKNPRSEFTIRLSAIRALLAMENPAAAGLWAQAVRETKGVVNRIELGLTALEYAKMIKPAMVMPLKKTSSPLLQGISRAAVMAAGGRDPIPELLKLINQGQPIFLNWVLSYANETNAAGRAALCAALVKLSTIVDGDRTQDYQRGVLAAAQLADADSPVDRKLLVTFLGSAERGVMEATLAGMLRSSKHNFAPLILPALPRLVKNRDARIGQYAAIILAREGSKAGLSILSHVVRRAADRSDGFRAVAGWYYAKLTGQTAELLAGIAEPTTQPVKPKAG